MEKVTITKELAETIEHFRNPDGYDWSNGGIMHEHFSEYSVGCEHRKTLRESDADELMTALINGYEVEKTPEEMLREYYEDLRKSSEGSVYDYRAEGVEMALTILGIKIEGVSRNETRM